MSFLYSYINSLIQTSDNNNSKIEEKINIDVNIDSKIKDVNIDSTIKDVNKIRLDEISSVKLKKIETFETFIDTDDQLKEILNIKLKPIKINHDKHVIKIFPPRNPVINEMHKKFGLIHSPIEDK